MTWVAPPPPCHCNFCGDEIFSDDPITLEGRFYHRQCFNEMEAWFRDRRDRMHELTNMELEEIVYDPTTHEWRECDGE